MSEPSGKVSFETGNLTPEEISEIFNSLPVDVTFVGSDDTVRYYSETKDRLFPRTKAIIGKPIQDCHPQQYVNKVNKIIGELKSGKKNYDEFWINSNGKLIFIRYYTIRDHAGKYLGMIEVAQDITDIQKIRGEKKPTE